MDASEHFYSEEEHQDDNPQSNAEETVLGDTEEGNESEKEIEQNVVRRNWLQRIFDFLANRRIEEEEFQDILKNDGNPFVILKDRYINKRHCPYCFGFVSKRIFRIKSRPGRRMKIGPVSYALPKFKTYECPNCQAWLPMDFFENKSTSIALVGGTESGKSSFITVFCELLINRQSLLSELGIFGSIVNEEGKDLFEKNHWRLIKQHSALLGTTNINRPIVVRLQSKHHSKVTYITLIDSPGEHFEELNTLLEQHPNLQYADGIIFLMNPIDIKGIAELVEEATPGTVPSQYQRKTIQNFDIIENLYQLFIKSKKIKPQGRIKIPTVFCISRADILEEATSLYIPPDFNPDMSELEDVIEEMKLVEDDIRELFEETDLRLLNLMDKYFSNYGLFPVSPLGKMPISDAHGQKIKGGVDPKGILQPFVWILKELNFIKTS